jgi:hypothetical protein
LNSLSYAELYTSKADQLTLGNALELHYQFNPQFTRWDLYRSSEAKDLIKAHDISHVIFGCNTGLLGELQVQIWSKFAIAPLSLTDKIRYGRDKESRVLLKNPIGYRKMIVFFIRNFGEVKRIRARCSAMRKKWPYLNGEEYFSTKLGEIRSDFGIVL